jgi:hypothetical protein
MKERSSNMTTVCFAKLMEDRLARCTVYTMCGDCGASEDQDAFGSIFVPTREDRSMIGPVDELHKEQRMALEGRVE